MQQARIAIVGAGAAGLLAAARIGQGALLLDGSAKPGKKLLATGNGRCNLTHLNISPGGYHGDIDAAASLLAAVPAGRVLGEFERLGLLTRTDAEGRCYPNSLQAAAVLQTLWSACEETGVKTCWDFLTAEVRRKKGTGFLLRAVDGREVLAEKLVLATGGKASPKHGGGRGYDLARSLGHTVTDLIPSLVPLKTDPRRTRSLKGQRCRARAALCKEGRELASKSGEVLFGDGQLSGICIFDLSANLRENGYAPGQPGWTVRLDALEGRSPEELLAYFRALRESRPALQAGELLAGAVNLRLGQELVKGLGFPREKPLRDLTERDLQKAVQAAKGMEFPVTGIGGWDAAQVTAGGVPLAEVDLNTMQSRKCPGLYVLGELLDVDGGCGGYNLHWAWATALRFADELGV